MKNLAVVNFLAIIQIFVAFDFGLFFLDERHSLTKVYRNYKRNLKAAHRRFQRSATAYLWHGEKFVKEGRRTSVEYREILGKVKKYLSKFNDHVSEGKINFKEWAFLGLYSGVYGLICLFFLCFSKCERSFFAESVILVCAELTLIAEAIIILKLIFGERDGGLRNARRNVTIIVLGLMLALILVYFDLTLNVFDSFEVPFLFSMLIVIAPIVVCLTYHFWLDIRAWYLRLRTQYYLSQLKKFQ